VAAVVWLPSASSKASPKRPALKLRAGAGSARRLKFAASSLIGAGIFSGMGISTSSSPAVKARSQE